MKVFILTKCDSLDTLYGNTLVFRTIRTGFPTADITVYDLSSSERAQKAIHSEATKARAVVVPYVSQEPAGAQSEHGAWIEEILECASEPFVICDPDVIFWESMENLSFPKDTLLAGRYIPGLREMKATIAPRLHPSLLFIPDPPGLREAVAAIRAKTPYFFPFRPYTYTAAPDVKVILDTAASASAMFPGRSYAFGEAELNRYDHIFQGTQIRQAPDFGMAQTSVKAVLKWHEIAKGTDLMPLRGIWRKQEVAFGGPHAAGGLFSHNSAHRISWHHYVGFLYDSEDAEEMALQVTTFFAGEYYLLHVAIVKNGARMVVKREGETKDVPTGFHIKGEVEDGDIRVRWDFMSADTVYSHGEGGVVKRYGVDCHHGSRPRNAARVHISDHRKSETAEFVGSVWYDTEEVPIEAIRGWDWLAITFTDASKGDLMIYAPAGDTAWGAWMTGGEYVKLTPADFLVSALETYMSLESGRIFGCRWRLDLKDGSQYTIAPLVEDQEIVDEATGPYWEGACAVLDASGKRVGNAFFEASGYPIPNEMAVGLRWTRGDKDAAMLLAMLARGSQVADDLVDGDTKPSEKGKTVVEMVDLALREIPANPFFQKHAVKLGPVIALATYYWEASNEWQKSPRRTTRVFGFVLREAMDLVIVAVALIVGGRDWARKILREVHAYYHVLDQETLEQWEAEHV